MRVCTAIILTAHFFWEDDLRRKAWGPFQTITPRGFLAHDQFSFRPSAKEREFSCKNHRLSFAGGTLFFKTKHHPINFFKNL